MGIYTHAGKERRRLRIARKIEEETNREREKERKI
jgi:hypothetical protein